LRWAQKRLSKFVHGSFILTSMFFFVDSCKVISGQLDVAVYDTAGDADGLKQHLNPTFGMSASTLHRFTYAPSLGWSPFVDQAASSAKTLGSWTFLFWGALLFPLFLSYCSLYACVLVYDHICVLLE